MNQEELRGKAQTVLGIIDADSLGVTLPHEHLLIDEASYFVEPTEATEKRLAHEPVSMENLYWVKTHCLTSLDDSRFNDEQVIIDEAMFYKEAGGDAIVELSCSSGLGRDPLGLARIARATGLNIVMGTGEYVESFHPPELATKTEGEISEEFIRDIMVGVGSTGVRAGIIGEIGCSVPLHDNERKVLRASAAAQRRTGAALNIHQLSSEDVAMEIVRILGDAGGDLSRTAISHIDSSILHPTQHRFDRTLRQKLLETGCYLEYDSFGNTSIFPPIEGFCLDSPSDAERVNDIRQFIAEGYLNQILLSHDICFKHALRRYGGWGYAHILNNIVPMMRRKGISDEQIHTLLVENPKRLLTFSAVK